MRAALLDRVERWEPAPMQLIEVEFARLCEQFESSLISAKPAVESPAESVDWAIPGVTGLDRPEPDALPPVSPEISALIAAYDRVAQASPAKSDAQALVDNEALLGLEQRMRVDSLGRIAEVSRRGLHELVGFRSVRTWLRARRPDGDSSDATLALKVADYPVLRAAVAAGEVPLSNARRVVKAIERCWNHLDSPGGCIDGQPGDEVLPAVVGNAIAMVCRYLNGLQDDDPRLTELIVARRPDPRTAVPRSARRSKPS